MEKVTVGANNIIVFISHNPPKITNELDKLLNANDEVTIRMVLETARQALKNTDNC